MGCTCTGFERERGDVIAVNDDFGASKMTRTRLTVSAFRERIQYPTASYTSRYKRACHKILSNTETIRLQKVAAHRSRNKGVKASKSNDKGSEQYNKSSHKRPICGVMIYLASAFASTTKILALQP